MNDFLKNLLKFCFVVIMLGVILVIAVYMIIAKRPSYSESENRPLKTMPPFSFVSLLNGERFGDLHEYYNDTVPGREEFKEFGSGIVSKLKGLPSDDIIIVKPPVVRRTDEPDHPGPVGTPEPTAEPVTEVPGTPTPTPTPYRTLAPDETPVPATPTPVPTRVPTPTPTNVPTPTPTPDENAEFQYYDNDGALIYQWRGMELYGGSRKAMERYAAAVANIKTRRPDVNVYTMTVPIASMYYLPAKLQSSAREQEKELNYLQSLFPSGVTVVDAHSVLKQHTSENIFLRTDHHWTHLGAYYCAQEFARAAGVPFTDISAYTRKVRSGYVGSFYSYFKMTELKDHPEEFVYYVSPHSVKVNYYNQDTFDLRPDLGNSAYFETLSTRYAYSIPMYFDDVISITETGTANGRVLMIVKDSYGNPIPSFLFGSFERIIMIDPRYYKLSFYDMLDDYGVTDVLSLANIFSHSTTSFVKLFESVYY